MKPSFSKQCLSVFLVFSLVCPPGFAMDPPGENPVTPPAGDCDELLLTNDGAGVSPELSRDQRILELSSAITQTKAAAAEAIKQHRAEIEAALKAERIEKTRERVIVARQWIRESLARASGELDYARSRLDAIKNCPPPSGKVAWAGRQVACAYWNASAALAHLHPLVKSVTIGYSSEILGLDSAGIKKVVEVRKWVLEQSDSERALLAQAEARNDTTAIAKHNLNLTVLNLEKWTLPFLTGAWSQLLQTTASTAKWLTTQQSPEQKAKNAAGRVAAFNGVLKNLWDAVTAWNLSKMRKNTYVAGDYFYRLGLVAFSTVIVNFAKAIPSLPYFTTTPWQLLPNAAIMMGVQSEIAARNTDVQTGRLPAKNMDILWERIAGIIAGEEGFIHGFTSRLNSFTTAIPMEVPVMAVVSLFYFWLTGQADLFTSAALGGAFSTALSFVGGFGFYLVGKWATWDKLVELGFIPEYRGLASREYNEKMVELFKKHGLPVDIHTVFDPDTNTHVEMELPAWHGGMWKHWASCFVPEGRKSEDVTMAESVAYYRSGDWRPRMEEFKEQYARFQEFNQSEEVVALNASPEGKRRTRQREVEFAYRLANTAFDTFVATMMAGKPPGSAVATAPAGK